MFEIPEGSLINIINTHCSCGGRGPNDNPCTACKIWHDLVRFKRPTEEKIKSLIKAVREDSSKVVCDGFFKCKDWEENIPQINAALFLAENHGMKYTGKPFEYCPWCKGKVR